MYNILAQDVGLSESKGLHLALVLFFVDVVAHRFIDWRFSVP